MRNGHWQGEKQDLSQCTVGKIDPINGSFNAESSTKVRVVFDASCKTSSGYSLKDTPLVGPVVWQDLYL